MKMLLGPNQGLYHRAVVLTMNPKVISASRLWDTPQHRPALISLPHPSKGQRAAAGHRVLLCKF